ncbi:MAG: class I SAM-dependent methyltransferase, partial [Myxococcales bacterium]|nr:class I SAM-dependent methyltransferase [Myxococcales bacterium]
ELGCGTGRLTVPLARAGVRIHGIDRSGPMLSRLAARLERLPPLVRDQISFAEADYLSPEATPPADMGAPAAVLWPFNALHHCPGPDAVAAVLRKAGEWVGGGGRLAVDCYLPDRELYSRDPDQRYEFRTFVDPSDGGMLESWEQGWWDEENRVHHVVYTYRSGDGRERRSHLSLRMYELAELHALIAASGWRIVREVRDFDGTPLGPRPLKWIAVLER